MMGRTGRLRNEIAQYLEDNGESNTSQILEHIEIYVTAKSNVLVYRTVSVHSFLT